MNKANEETEIALNENGGGLIEKGPDKPAPAQEHEDEVITPEKNFQELVLAHRRNAELTYLLSFSRFQLASFLVKAVFLLWELIAQQGTPQVGLTRQNCKWKEQWNTIKISEFTLKSIEIKISN